MTEQPSANGFDERIRTVARIWNVESRWLWAIPGLAVGFIVGVLVGGQIAVTEFFNGIWPEALGLAFTVLILDRLNRRLANSERRKNLISQMGSYNNDIARDAVRELRAYGWISDGTLVQAGFTKGNLSNADLHKSNLVGAIFMFTQMVEIDLRWSDLRYTLLFDCNLERAKLEKINLTSANLEFSTLVEVQANGADFTGATLEFAKLHYANLSEAIMINTDFEGAVLIGANLSYANLIGANLLDADLTDANLTGAILPNGSEYDGSQDISKFTNIEHSGFWQPDWI